MGIHSLAGKTAPPELLINVSRLLDDYQRNQPNLDDPYQLVSFGTSGHRGSSTKQTFTEAHILAISQAICDYRISQDISGPLFLGKDSHALSEPAQQNALEVLAANKVETYFQENDGTTPTPVISHAILCYNRGKTTGLADGIVITPSHNPPSDGGFKYNPPNGGPADTEVTNWIQERANELLRAKNSGVKRISYQDALRAETSHSRDFITPYVEDLGSIVDLDAIKNAGVRIGADPLGGSSVDYWGRIGETYGLDISVVNPNLDPTFSFMTVDHDGKIRMDCSSVYAMAKLVQLKDSYSIAFGNDPDADRHGIVTPSVGLMNPNHYLAVAIRYLFSHRTQWPAHTTIGKTLVSSGIIDRVATSLGRKLAEVPVGFKWFVSGLFDGSYGFGGEESAGASFLRKDGTVWTTDKDGLIMGLLAAEITAVSGKDPGEHFAEISEQFGTPYYARIDRPSSPEEKSVLKGLSPEAVTASSLAGEPIVGKHTRAPGNDAPIGGLKVVTENGWFAARPSGTENIYKLYAESFKSKTHLEKIQDEASAIVSKALAAG